jgi:hypothetical protein
VDVVSVGVFDALWCHASSICFSIVSSASGSSSLLSRIIVVAPAIGDHVCKSGAG